MHKYGWGLVTTDQYGNKGKNQILERVYAM